VKQSVSFLLLVQEQVQAQTNENYYQH